MTHRKHANQPTRYHSSLVGNVGNLTSENGGFCEGGVVRSSLDFYSLSLFSVLCYSFPFYNFSSIADIANLFQH